MAIGVFFYPDDMTSDQYSEVLRKLDAAGQADPDRSFGDDRHLRRGRRSCEQAQAEQNCERSFHVRSGRE